MTQDEAYIKISKIAREHALIYQAADGMMIILHPDTQREKGVYNHIQWVHGLGPHPERIYENDTTGRP